MAPNIQRRVMEVSRKEGRIEWVQCVRTLSNELTNEELEVSIELLNREREWEELWSVLQIAPPILCTRILLHLQEANWRGTGPDEYSEFVKLLELANACPQKIPPMFIGRDKLNDLKLIQRYREKRQLSTYEIKWAKFILALWQWRKRHDIEVSEESRISIKNFDIEIE